MAGAVGSLALMGMGWAVLGSAIDAVVLGIATLIAVVFDTTRYEAISDDRWRPVAMADLAGLGLVAATGLGLTIAGVVSIAAMSAAWGARALLGLVVLRALPSAGAPRAAWFWVSRNRSLVGPLTAETGLFMTAGYAVNWVVAAIADFVALGIYRAAQVAMNPIVTLGQSATVLLLRTGRDRAQAPGGRWQRLLLPVALLEAAIGLWLLALLIPGVGSILFGENWDAISSAIWIAAAGQMFGCITLVATALMKVDAGPRRALQFRATVFWVDLVAVGIGAATVPVLGALIGLAVGQVVVAFVALGFYAASPRRRESPPQ